MKQVQISSGYTQHYSVYSILLSSSWKHTQTLRGRTMHTSVDAFFITQPQGWSRNKVCVCSTGYKREHDVSRLSETNVNVQIKACLCVFAVTLGFLTSPVPFAPLTVTQTYSKPVGTLSTLDLHKTEQLPNRRASQVQASDAFLYRSQLDQFIARYLKLVAFADLSNFIRNDFKYLHYICKLA